MEQFREPMHLQFRYKALYGSFSNETANNEQTTEPILINSNEQPADK